GGSTYSNITGATNSSFAQASVPVGQNGYRFRVIVTAGCGSVTSTAGILTVNAFPVITFNPAGTVCVSDAAFSLSATPAGGTFSGTGVSGNNFIPSVAGVGTKSVMYTATNAGCQSAATRTIRVNECAERHLTLSQEYSITVYPNPNRGRFNIRLNTDLYNRLNVAVYNSLGQQVKSQVFAGLSYGSVIRVNLDNFPAGTYHLLLSEEDTGKTDRRSEKLVVYK
ncbi:MAG: T9SS type A sorting domain-containing protein, partial [Chitinophagaceae bacterium]|nr:T9SS type A sorting domain-containing protein [Chitinophagaceae bacterium]